MAKQRAALGKGLGALLAEANEIQNNREIRPSAENPASIADISIDVIEPNPYQPRISFDNEALSELSESIRSYGVIQPITLRKIADNRYQIISGERRFRAAKMANLKFIPAYVRTANDTQMLEMAIVENIQRENLDAIETAISFQRLIDECNLTQEGMADRVGKKRATITNYLRLLKLPVEIQKAIKLGKVSAGHAKALLSLEDKEMQLSLCDLIIREDLSVRQTEEKVRKLVSSPTNKEKTNSNESSSIPDSYYKVAEIVGKYFENNVTLKRSPKGSGTMTVRFKDDSQLNAFLEAIQDKRL